MAEDDKIDTDEIAPEVSEASETPITGDAPLDDVNEAPSDDIIGGLTAELQPPKRKKRRFFAALGGIVIALGAGGIGGFAAHEYFDVAPPLPDLSAIERDIENLQKTTKAQTARNKTLETQIKTANRRFGQDISSLEDKWQGQLADLDQKIEAIEIPSLPPATVNITPNSENAETPTLDDDNAARALETIIDPRPELLAVVDDLRRAVEDDITQIKDRLERLESEPEVVPLRQGEAGPEFDNSSAVDFPRDEILAALKSAESPDSPKNWIGKILNKHISLKSTGHDQAAAYLDSINAAILIEDWDGALELSERLPESARISVQEWIARARL